MNSYVWCIDSGHSGNTQNGDYLTAPAKMFKHSPSEIFYEGVFNRQIKDALIRDLWRHDILAIDVCPTELDLPLSVRVNIVNAIYAKYKNAVLISLHSNAGRGTGIEIWTARGQTRSDKFATVIGEQVSRDFEDVVFRQDFMDGDMDKEADFYILKYTHCPAVLPEFMFYDNYDDFLKLENPEFRARYVKSLLTAIQKMEQMDI